MIPFIRSFSELMAITESRDTRIVLCKNNGIKNLTVDSRQINRDISSPKKSRIDLPYLPKKIKCNWTRNREALLKFLNTIDYNNEIQKSYEITLIARQNKNNHKDAA